MDSPLRLNERGWDTDLRHHQRPGAVSGHAANAGVDYVAQGGAITIEPGEYGKSVNIRSPIMELWTDGVTFGLS
jgi:hypothetical protein